MFPSVFISRQNLFSSASCTSVHAVLHVGYCQDLGRGRAAMSSSTCLEIQGRLLLLSPSLYVSFLHLCSQFSALAAQFCCIQWEYPWETSPNLATRGIVLESWKHNPQFDLSVSSEINKMKSYFVHYELSGLSRHSCIPDIFRNGHLYFKRIDTCKIFHVYLHEL